MKLWLAFAREDDRDVQLARAAIGALAMAVPEEPRIARALAKENGSAALAHVLATEHPELVHRAAYCLTACLEDRRAREGLLAGDAIAREALTRTVAAARTRFADGPAGDALEGCAAALARTDWEDGTDSEDDEADARGFDSTAKTTRLA